MRGNLRKIPQPLTAEDIGPHEKRLETERLYFLCWRRSMDYGYRERKSTNPPSQHAIGGD